MHIIVIGGGPGGYVAALKAAKMGAQCTIIEKGNFGGTCLNVGCIPTKAYLHSSDLLVEGKEAGKFGVVNQAEPTLDFSAVFARKNAVVNQLVSGVGFLMKKNKITVEKGFGKVLAAGKVEVTAEDGSKKTVEGDKIIIATGSVPIVPGMFGYDKDRIITSDELLGLANQPKSMIIVGGGVVGCEFGQFFNRIGTQVSIVELAPQILPNEDAEVVELLRKKMAAEKIDFHIGVGADKVEKTADSVKVTLSDGKVLEAEYLLVSIGRRAFTDGAWEQSLKIATEKGKIVVDEYMRTNIEGIYAIGDTVDTPFLAHVASKEALVAVEDIMGVNNPVHYRAVPRCVYTDPQIACVGSTEKELAAKGIEYKVGKFGFGALGKSMVNGKGVGFVKILVDSSDKIIGAAIVGDQATELLTELTLAVDVGLTAHQVGNVIHPHPSLSEALMEALHDVHKQSVHAL